MRPKKLLQLMSVSLTPLNMDGEVQPKFGLMVSLVLMNVTAVVIFFFATPSKETVKKQSDDTEYFSPLSSDNGVERISFDRIRDPAKKGTVEQSVDSLATTSKGQSLQLPLTRGGSVGENADLSRKPSKSQSPEVSLVAVQNMPGKDEMTVISTYQKSGNTNYSEPSDRRVEPPLATALKRLVVGTNSGVRTFFEGLKNGYNRRRIRESISGSVSMKKSGTMEGRASRRISSAQKTVDPQLTLLASNSLAPQSTNEISPMLIPTQIVNSKPAPSEKFGDAPPQKPENEKPLNVPPQEQTLPEPASALKHQEVVRPSNQDSPSTEIIMDALSRAQQRTNELIYLFNKRVVPAIDRMNDRVAEAVRLEKNLDSYTSALINAINSFICPNADAETTLKRKPSKPRTSVVKRLRQTKAFVSDSPLMRDSRLRDYIGNHSIGEPSRHNKTPVFKTLTAHCWHKRYRRMFDKLRKQRSRVRDLTNPEVGQLEQVHEVSNAEKPLDHLEQTAQSEIKTEKAVQDIGPKGTAGSNPVNVEIDGSSLKLMESLFQRTIGIEEVLALTSSLENSSDQEIQSDTAAQSFYSPLSSMFSLSSGVACRSCDIASAEPHNADDVNKASEVDDVNMESEQTRDSAASQNLELLNDSSEQAEHKADAFLRSDLSVVCDSQIQDYNSDLAQKEISTVVVYSPRNHETQLTGRSKSADMDQSAELGSRPSISLKNTTELVNIFQQLNRQQKEVAMENVCLLVLRMFEAWTECQRSVSSLESSKISLRSCPSDEEVSQCSRPCTAICKSANESSPKQMLTTAKSLPTDNASKNPTSDGPANDLTEESGHVSAEISRTVVHNVVQAAEIQIAERSLKGLKTNLLRYPPSKGDVSVSCVNSSDISDQSGFGDIQQRINADEELAISLASKSRESIKISKESSTATFYTTSQQESSEETFYECGSAMSARTCLSNDLEIQDSSTLFLERIQEEETRLSSVGNTDTKHAVTEPVAAKRSFSVESWLSDSREELFTAKETLSEDLPSSDYSSFNIACSTDDDVSLEFSADDCKAHKSKKTQSKKKKWATKLLRKLLMKKSKSSNSPGGALSQNASRSDTVMKSSDENVFVKNDEPTR